MSDMTPDRPVTLDEFLGVTRWATACINAMVGAVAEASGPDGAVTIGMLARLGGSLERLEPGDTFAADQVRETIKRIRTAVGPVPAPAVEPRH